MRAPLLCGALVLQFFVSPAFTQGTTEGEAHILSAFTTRIDPRVLAADVALGPVAREQLGAPADREGIYEELLQRTLGRQLRVSSLGPGEVVRYASLQGITPGAQLIQLDAADLSLILQYDAKQKNVTFIEQISAPPLRAAPEPPKPVVEVAPPPPPPPPPPVVEVPKPPVVEAPPAVAPAVAPAVVPPVAAPAKPKPKPAAVAAPKAAPAAPPAPAVTPPAPIARAVPAAPAVVAAPRTPPKPRGDCVIKPVMSEEDLWNCSAPAKPAAMSTLAAPAPAAAAAPAAAPAALQAPADCVIKPVMSEEDLRICAAAARSRRVVTNTPSEPVAAAPAAQPSAPMLTKPTPECVIKPVMTEEELRICAAASRQSRPASITDAPVQAVAAPPAATAGPGFVKPTPECVIKPVMSEEELRICAAASRQSRPPAITDAPAQAVAAPPAQPSAPMLTTPAPECVIKPVMSEADLRACGVRR